MSQIERANSSENENLCVVCFKNVEIYSFGVCNHPVCFECSTRMRVLCRQNECPICRQDMPKVIFTRTIEPFSIVFPRFERSSLQDRKFGLYFCTTDIQKAYYQILEHRCQVCEATERKWPFKTFQQLKDHMRREHELFYCDICVENLKIFSFERRCYTRQELGHHRRKGDLDNTSHRGHPLCEFCDARYMDNDELFRHLRRHHFFCHFCDADGKHQYYNNMEELRRHFKDEHFLCEEGECKSSPLTAVFRTDIDMKAHIATEHSRYMSKSATKQARTLELEFTLAPRARLENSRNGRLTNRRERADVDNFPLGQADEPGGPGGGGGEGASRMFVNALTPQDFPALGGATSSVTLHSRPASNVNFTSRLNSNFSREDFPSLGGPKSSSAITITSNSASTKSNRAPEVTITRTPRNQQQPQAGATKPKDHFPALGSTGAGNNGGSGSSTVRLSVNSSQDPNSPKVSIQVNSRSNGAITTHITTMGAQQRPSEAFPLLGKTTSEVSKPQWVQAKSKKAEQKNKVATAPRLPPSNLEQFPTLSGAAKKGTFGTTSNSWVNLNNINSSASENRAKMEKLKQESKPSEPTESKSKSKKKKNKSELETKKAPLSGKAPVTSKAETKPEPKPTQNECKDDNDNSNLQNGLVKKRSELKIGTLTNIGEASIVSNDVSTMKPPPGFNVKPPPGLSPSSFPSLNSVANDLTFTSSSGQRYSITPSISYHQPSNFQSRNLNLITKIMEVVDNDTIKEFKTYSDLFRNGGFPTDNYYEHCKIVLGSTFDDVFPELLVLLPDIQKQQELYKVYKGKNKENLVICENCKQVIYKKELGEHYNYHLLDNQFPSLGSSQQQQISNAWRK